MTTPLGGRPRSRLVAQVRARTDHPVCPLCGYRVDRSLPRMGKPHPLSSVVDEWYPRALGGDPHDPDNCVEMHAACNSIKSDTWPVTHALATTCKTHIDRLLARNTPTLNPW